MEIKEIKERLSILTVLDHYGIKVLKNRQCLCPFHDDKNPSMQVYPETNTVFCFSGNCEHTGKSIDVIDFILHKEGCTKHEAIKKAKTIASSGNYLEPTPKVKQAESINHEKAFKRLVTGLNRSKPAQEYLKSRNIYDTKLEIGFKSSTNHDFKGMRDCVIFPLKSKEGDIVSFYGRSIKATGGTGGHYYQKERSGLYPHYPNKEVVLIILTESIIDAATLQKHLQVDQNRNYYDVLALYGTNGLTSDHTEAVSQLENLQEIVLWLDGDEAGNRATLKHSKTLHEQLPRVKISRVEMPEGEDINSLLDGHTQGVFETLLSSRDELYGYEKVRDQLKVTSHLNTEDPEQLIFKNDLLQISVLGGIALKPVDKLKVTLKIVLLNSHNPLHKIRHSLDLYHDDQLEKLINKTVERLDLGTREVQSSVALLIDELENYRTAQLEQEKPKKAEKRLLTAERIQKAEEFLRSDNLLKATNDLLGQSGIVGEEINRLLMYLVFTSRKRSQPLHIISLGGSGTGKTYLQEKVSAIIPEDEKLEITALSENALYYFDRTELKNKLVLIEDLDGANDDKVLYAIRELQSKKRISKTLPIKDSKGNMKTVTLRVEGPISLAGTTTREKLYEDNANRSILIYLDQSRKHKEEIMSYQRKLSAGEIDRSKEDKIKEFLRDVQSVLKPISVRNPYATQLIIPETVFKPLRTNAHYLNFIEVVTFYCQYQRVKKVDESTGEEFIETTIEDIRDANWLLKEVLLSKSDELTKGCRDFYERLKGHLKKGESVTFYSQDIRLPLRISPNNLKYYLSILLRYNRIRIVGGHPRKKGYEYELMSEGDYEKLNSQIDTSLDKALEKIEAG